MRLAMSAAVVAAGLSLICAGPAAATEGAAGSGIAAAVQYQPEDTGSVPVTPPVTTTTPSTSTTPTEASVTPPPVTTATTPATPSQAPSTPAPTKHTTPHAAPSAPANEPVAQTPAATPVEQAGPSTLPFTGYDLIPVALIGLALLAMGALLRRHSRSGRSS
jgi:hypothetical protein